MMSVLDQLKIWLLSLKHTPFFITFISSWSSIYIFILLFNGYIHLLVPQCAICVYIFYDFDCCCLLSYIWWLNNCHSGLVRIHPRISTEPLFRSSDYCFPQWIRANVLIQILTILKETINRKIMMDLAQNVPIPSYVFVLWFLEKIFISLWPKSWNTTFLKISRRNKKMVTSYEEKSVFHVLDNVHRRTPIYKLVHIWK